MTPFLTLELVEGEDLRQRLARGALPLDEVLEVALQIAEALEEAHNKGIVHRDLKPANIKLTPDGKVKVLDFGLAKAWAADGADGRSSSPDVSDSPTRTKTGTKAGAILGTAGYMSPEQARGQAVDRRADIWAFGAVLEGPDFADYSVTADGQRFLVKRPVEGSEKPRIHVLLDWPSLVSARSSTFP